MFFQILSTLIIVSLASKAESRSISNTKYAIIFDGGSKGTRLNLFSYRTNLKRNDQIDYQQLVNINLDLYCELNDDGLSTYEANDSINLKFDPCLKKATQLIPTAQQASTIISLGATAGLRLLEIKNRSLSDAIQQNIRVYFKQSGYLFVNNNQVRIITGGEEGSYAWIGANYLKNKLNPNVTNQPETTYGILDMGGSSAQVSYLAPIDKSLDNYNLEYYFQNFKIQNVSYKAYSVSYLCYGTTSILNMYYANRIIDQNYSKKTILTSCLPDGASITLTGEDFLNSPCTNGLMFKDNRTFTVNKDLIKSGDKFTILGNAKKDKCRTEISNLMSTFCPYGTNKCSFNGYYMPTVKNFKFFALSNFYEAFDYTERLFKISIKNNLELFNQTTYTLCNMKLTDLTKLNNNNNVGVSKKRLVKLCVENVYIIKLFELYGFNSLDDIDAVEEINDKKASWALGYLIYLLNN